jgi:hypothetical protein
MSLQTRDRRNTNVLTSNKNGMGNLIKNFSCVEKTSQQTLILGKVGGYETDSFKLVWMRCMAS